MKPYRNHDGFTLVELMVTIAIGSLVTLAATTVLLLGLRMTRQSQDTIIQQNTTRIFLTMLENLATEGTITGINAEADSWEIFTGDPNLEDEEIAGTVILSYDSKQQTIFTGDAASGTPLIEDVIASFVSFDDEAGLITFSLETEEGTYNSSIYCRTSVKAKDTAGELVKDIIGNDGIKEDGEDGIPDREARSAFLKKLVSQYSMAGGAANNPGLILGNGEDADENNLYYSTGRYYSQWYITDKFWNIEDGWNKDTPWCACFVSWALSNVTDELEELPENEKRYREENGIREYFWYANVDDFRNYIRANDNTHQWKESKANSTDVQDGSTEYTPLPGDLIFFDWNVDSVVDAQHVGVVLTIENDYIYTIEGNSAGRVAVRKYAMDDKRIMGYGVLDWKTDSGSTTNTDS